MEAANLARAQDAGALQDTLAVDQEEPAHSEGDVAMTMEAHQSTGHLELYEIGVRMGKSDLPEPFVADAVQTALEFEGVFELMVMWRDEEDEQERDQIIADIQDLVDDCREVNREERPYIRFDDLEKIAKNIQAFKDNLRLIVDERGGINGLSRLTGMPQPSLSRFFNSSSMPRRNTLLKIAVALDLSEVEISTKWTR
jgi:hypothetical protein